MDDISLLGEDAALQAALVDLIPLLREIGLEVNLNKTVVLEPTPSISSAFGIRIAPTGARLLGAWIGNDVDAISFINEITSSFSPFFSAIAKLPAELGLPVLQKCGVPKMNHLCRTNAPAVTNEAAAIFDELALNTFCQFAKLSPQVLDETSRLATHLPVSMGGVGITQFSRINSCAYDASVLGNSTSQKSLVKEINKTLFGSMPDNFKQHLRRCKSDSDWLSAAVPSSYFHRALQIRILCAGVNSSWLCDCGFRCASEREAIVHALGCSKLQGVNASTRSSAVKEEIARFCKINSIPCSVEPMLLQNPDGTNIRADVRISMPDADVYLDVVVATGGCKSHNHKSTTQLASEKSQLKEDIYLRPVQSLGGSFITFFVETMGELGPEAASLVKRLEKISISREPKALRRRIGLTLHRCNGAIVSNAFRSLAVRY